MDILFGRPLSVIRMPADWDPSMSSFRGVMTAGICADVYMSYSGNPDTIVLQHKLSVKINGCVLLFFYFTASFLCTGHGQMPRGSLGYNN